jgi:RNA polymerase sigma factor (sigma-70 family)
MRKESAPPTRLTEDEYELDTVVASYWEPVLQWIRSTGKVRGGEAEEVRQEVFLRVTREIRAGRRYGLPIGAAIYQITNWTIRGYVARAAGHREREQPIGDMPYREPVDHRAGDEIDRVGQDDLVQQLFDRLGDREGTLMTMHYLQGLELAEVAEAMGITANNAHQIHHRAKQRIHVWLVEDGT